MMTFLLIETKRSHDRNGFKKEVRYSYWMCSGRLQCIARESRGWSKVNIAEQKRRPLPAQPVRRAIETPQREQRFSRNKEVFWVRSAVCEGQVRETGSPKCIRRKMASIKRRGHAISFRPSLPQGTTKTSLVLLHIFCASGKNSEAMSIPLAQGRLNTGSHVYVD